MFALYFSNRSSNAKDEALKRYQAQAGVEIATANARAEEAKKDADEARKGTAKALATAAKLNEQAEAERLARVKIEERLSPRRLDANARLRGSAKLNAFPGTACEVVTYRDDPEAMGLAQDILFMLRDAGWARKGEREWSTLFGAVIMGVEIRIPEDHADILDAPASALGRALASEGIEATKQIDATLPKSPIAVLLLRVGRKP